MNKCKKCGILNKDDNYFECVDCGSKFCKNCAEKTKMICPVCYNEVRQI